MRARKGFVNTYKKVPLFARILVAAALGALLGITLGTKAADLKLVSDLILQALRLLATPLIFLSLVHSPLLLPLDWILDRFRTMINVAGDLAATCIVDGSRRSETRD